MEKIEKVRGKDGSERNLEDLAALYKAELEKDGFLIKVRKKIIETGKNASEDAVKLYFERLSADLDDDLIVASPEKMRLYIAEYEAAFTFLKKQKNELPDVMCYKAWRGSNTAKWLAEMLNIKTCPYCNAQFTLTVKNSKGKETKAMFQFDHFHPKSIYPYLSISFFNLIPSCTSCNQGKGNETKALIHPYEGSFDSIAKFSLTLDSFRKTVLGEKDILPDVELKCTDNAFKNNFDDHVSIFNLENVHRQHTDILQELMIKAYIYNDSRIEELLSNYGGLFQDRNELLRILLGGYLEKGQMHKRPLSKLTKDIAEELGLV